MSYVLTALLWMAAGYLVGEFAGTSAVKVAHRMVRRGR